MNLFSPVIDSGEKSSRPYRRSQKGVIYLKVSQLARVYSDASSQKFSKYALQQRSPKKKEVLFLEHLVNNSELGGVVWGGAWGGC